VAGIRTLPAANRYLREQFLPAFNAEFERLPADPASAFVPLGGVDLEQVLCHEEARVVAPDNTVRLDGVVLQIAKQRGRRTRAGLPVVIRRHLNGTHAVWWGSRCLGRQAGLRLHQGVLPRTREEPAPFGDCQRAGQPLYGAQTFAAPAGGVVSSVTERHVPSARTAHPRPENHLAMATLCIRRSRSSNSS
jgi:hypothetical protein